MLLQCQQTLYVQTPGRFHRHPHQSQRHKDPSRAWWEGPKDNMVHPGVQQICLLKSLSAKVNSLPWFTSPPLSHPLSNLWPRRMKEWHYVTMFGCFMACLVRKVLYILDWFWIRDIPWWQKLSSKFLTCRIFSGSARALWWTWKCVHSGRVAVQSFRTQCGDTEPSATHSIAMHSMHMGASLKWVYPQITNFKVFFHHTPSS